jgi:hypothetical protein
MTWRCPNCGHINQDINTNCAQCGTSSYGGPPPIEARKQPVAKGPPQWALRRAGEWAQREMPTPTQTSRSRLTNLFASVMGFIRGPAERKRLAILQNQRTEAANMETRIQRGFNEFVGQSATPEDISKYNENQLRERSEEEAREATIQATRRRADWEDEEYRKDKEEMRKEREEGYNKKLSKMQVGEEDVDEDHTRCERCWKVYKKSEPFCKNCHYQNREYHLPPGKMFCYYCKAVISVHDKICPNCKKSNKGYLATEALSKTTTKRISGKLYEILIYELVGIFVTFGLPFFGLPSLPLLGVVIMALLPFYSFLPDERQVLSSREVGELSLGGWGKGILLVKSSVKLVAFILTVIQFTFLVPVSKLIPLGICFAYYFTLPTFYKVTEPSKMIEAWFRLAVGGFIAWLMLGAFSYTSQAWTLAFMSAAFFITSFPKHKEAEEEGDVVRVKIEILKKAYSKENSWILELILRLIFLGFMFAAWFTSGIGIGTSSLQIIFISVFALSVFSGWVAGSDGRPALGILMILITLFAFTFTATGVMGQAVFGYWWPQVYAFGEAVTAPLIPLWEQVQTGMADSWLMLSNPMGYYNQMAKRQQATKTVPKEGGTVKSIEVTRTELFTTVSGELEPALDPLVGTMEVQNQGEFDADYIKLKVWATWQDPQTLEETCTGTFYSDNFKCSSDVTPTITPDGNCQTGSCEWSSTTYPREIKLVTFIFAKGDDGGWIVPGPDPSLTACIDCGIPENATYVHGGQTVKVNTNVSYSYKVNVSIPVEVIEFKTYTDLLQAKEITLQDLTSQYTGGPVKATLWSQRQPIRAGEASLFVASIYNDGGGVIDKIDPFIVKIPKELIYDPLNPENDGKVEKVSSTFYTGTIGTDSCTGPVTNGDFIEITCRNIIANRPVKPGEYKRVSILITPKKNLNVDRMTRLIIGLADYDYTKTTSKSITVANFPYH